MAKIPLAFGLGEGGGSDEVTATRNQVLEGYTAITSDSNDEPIEGTIPSQGAQTIYFGTSDQVIPSGKYLSGNQTLKAISQANLSAENIRKGITASVSNGNGNIWSILGTYSTPSSGQSPIVPGAVRTGFSGFVNGGSEVQGAIPDQAARTIYANTSLQNAMASGYYAVGDIKVAALSQSGLNASNILRGKTISISNGNTNVWSVTGGTSGGIKCVSGTVYTTSWFDDGSYGIYNVPCGYADIAPGITPILVISRCLGGVYGNAIYLQDNLLYYSYYDQHSYNKYTTVSLPRTASQTRVLGVYPQGSNRPVTEYYIYGY